jgi:hypothetical protein
MNPQMKTLLVGGLLSLAGYVVGTIAFAVVGNLLLHGIQAAVDIFFPSVLLGMALGTAFSINALMFAVFYTMFVMQRGGLTVQNTLYWAAFYIAFNLIFGMLAQGLAVLSPLPLFLMVLQTMFYCFGAHFALTFLRR